MEKIYAFPSTNQLRCNITVKRTECAPWGVADGQDGATPLVELRSADGNRRLLRKSDVELNQGDVLRVVSGGGGGYGAGYFRDVESVLADVRDGYVSQEAALRDYGVILSEQGDIDQPATAVMRDKMLSGA